MNYPCVDISFLKQLAQDSTSIQAVTEVGNTTMFLFKGKSPIAKRCCFINNIVGEVTFEFATALATKAKKMKELMVWLEENKNWKEGAYIATMNKNQLN